MEKPCTRPTVLVKESGENACQVCKCWANNRRLASVGILRSKDPFDAYQYALIDPIDEPYVTFKHHICSRGEF